MTAKSLVRVGRIDELIGDGPFAVSADGLDIALVRTGSGWRALQGRCPHQGALLGEGEIEAGALVCRNHRWRFDLADGARIGGPGCLAAYPATERDGAVVVDLSGAAPAAKPAAARRPLTSVPGPKGLPVLGSALQLDTTRLHLILEEWSRAYGPTYQFRVRSNVVYVTRDLAMIEEALRARPETFRRSRQADAALSEAGIRGVFNAEGVAWRPQRKLAVAALAQRHLKALYPHILTVAGRLRRRWGQAAARGETLDVVEEMKRFTVDVTTLIAFGHDANTIDAPGDRIQDQIEIVLPTIARRIVSPFPLWRYVRLPRDRRFDAAMAAVRRWLESMLSETRARLAAAPERAAAPTNFIEAMTVAVDEDGRPFSDETILSNLITMLIAGEDTTAYTLSWAVHELSDNPRWQAELRREADAVLAGADVARDADAAGRLRAADAVAAETMRLRPAAPFFGVTAAVDTTLGGFSVPKGATILMLMRPNAVDPGRFADPDAFRPERWLGEPAGPHDVAAYAPFGSGPRMCPGRSLALIEMRVVLSMLCKAFTVERVGPAEAVAERFGFTMSPSGLAVRLTARA